MQRLGVASARLMNDMDRSAGISEEFQASAAALFNVREPWLPPVTSNVNRPSPVLAATLKKSAERALL